MLSLQAVESLLYEFYHPSTSNPRKKVIEHELIAFKNESQAWQQSFCYLNQFHHNQYVWFFMSSCLEHAITRKWDQLQLSDRSQIRDFLWSTYVKLPVSVQARQRDTIAQLIALMGKREFPEDHPVYFTHILELCRNNFQLGVVLLRVTSEEAVSEKQDVSAERKKHFQNCASLCMPEIFALLSKFIAISVCHINGTDFNLIPENLRDFTLHSALRNDSHVTTTISMLLTCLQHLFSWIPLENILDENFLLNIFELSRWREGDQEISIAGISAVTELFYVQKNVPCGKFIIDAIKGLLDPSNISHANEMYEEKFTELLRVFTAKFAKRLVHDEIFQNFICHLYQFTFNGTGALAFTEKLGVWTPLIKEICSTSNNIESYSDLFHSLVAGILRKYQYQYDQEQELDMLDNETLDFNMETEWQHFLNQCIEVITTMGKGLPHQVFNQVYSDWQRTFESFLSFENAIDSHSFDMQIYDQNKCHFIHCVLRDLTSLCQTLVSLAGTVESSKNEGCFENLLRLTQCLLYFVKFYMQRRECVQQIRNNSLRQYFVEMFPQVLQALRSLVSLSVFHKTEYELKELIDKIGQILLPSINLEQQMVCLASAQFLLSVTSVIRPKYMLEIPSILQLVQSGSNLKHLPASVQAVTYEMIINCFVLPWSNVPNQDQEFEKRGLVLNEYVTNLGNDIFEGQEEQSSKIRTNILPIFKDILEYFKDNSTSVKNMITNAFKPIITKTLTIFNSCECQEAADVVIAEFALSVLKTLQLQLGIAFVKEMLTIFMNWATSQKLSRNRMSAIEKILQMLHLVVEQPGNSTNALIPAILNMALNHIQPLLSGDEKDMFANTDVAVLLYTLFDSILYHRWQYFYKSHIHRAVNNPSCDYDIPQNADEMLSILTSYGFVLVQGNDPQVKRIILMSLQRVNERWKLFNRQIFQVNLLMSFQSAFINALLAPEGALFYDLLMSILFTMGQINVEKFHQSFILSGLFGGEEKLIEDICLSTDLPTFTQRMDRLIQNTRCVRLLEVR